MMMHFSVTVVCRELQLLPVCCASWEVRIASPLSRHRMSQYAVPRSLPLWDQAYSASYSTIATFMASNIVLLIKGMSALFRNFANYPQSENLVH